MLDLLKSSKLINHPLKHWAVKKSVERGNNSFIVLLHLDQPAGRGEVGGSSGDDFSVTTSGASERSLFRQSAGFAGLNSY